MINIFGYYSCGGYKDMYLGNNAGEPQPTYFLPLLPVMEARREENDLPAIEKLKGLKQIEILTSDKTCGFPDECNFLFSHGGYVSIYRTLSQGSTCLAIRDIYGKGRDEEGRSIPFNLMFVAEGSTDIRILDSFALAVKDNFNEWYSFLGELFCYDPIVNGIKFDLPGIIDKIQSLEVNEIFAHKNRTVDYLMIENLSSLDIAFTEQKLGRNTVNCVINKKGDILQGHLTLMESRKQEGKEEKTDDSRGNTRTSSDKPEMTEDKFNQLEAGIKNLMDMISRLESKINGADSDAGTTGEDHPYAEVLKRFPWAGKIARHKDAVSLSLLIIILIISLLSRKSG